MPGEGWGDPCELCPKEEEGNTFKIQIKIFRWEKNSTFALRLFDR